MCKKYPYSELFWSSFFRIRIEYGEILRISPYSVRMQENADQNKSEYGHFSRSVSWCDKVFVFVIINLRSFIRFYTFIRIDFRDNGETEIVSKKVTQF